MNRTPIQPDITAIPEVFHPYLANCTMFDSSCSPDARVIYLEKDGGLYLKSARKGSLKREAQMDAYFFSLGLGPEVVRYQSAEADWLLTRALRGEDCLHPDYMADPHRLAETMARMLRDLHHQDHSACPIQNHTEQYLGRAAENRKAGKYSTELFPGKQAFSSAEEAWRLVESHAKYLKTNTLLHGDYCLPNIMLDAWNPVGFIDVGSGGVGDKHVDLFWGAWSLKFNMKEDTYITRFLDAYGRENFQPEMLRVIAAIEAFL